jgi:hypothetical protein
MRVEKEKVSTPECLQVPRTVVQKTGVLDSIRSKSINT